MIVSFLSYGEDYHKEFLEISKNFNINDVLVVSDKNLGEYNTIITSEAFNFNLKHISITESLKKDDSVLYIDTDTIVQNPNYNLLHNIEDGIYVKWIGDVINYLDESITSNNISFGETSRNDVNNYGKELFKIVQKPIKFIDESILFIKLKNENKFNFIKNYKELVNQFKNNTPYRETDKKWGAIEGCLLWAAAELSNIKIDDKTLTEFFKQFKHYGPMVGHNIKNKKSIL